MMLQVLIGKSKEAEEIVYDKIGKEMYRKIKDIKIIIQRSILRKNHFKMSSPKHTTFSKN